MVVCMGTDNRIVAEPDTRRTMRAWHKDGHVSGRCVVHGTAQRLQVRVCCC